MQNMENTGYLYAKQVQQIKGTSIGMAIVQLTGIEGAERDERQEKLRKILQSLITYINQHPGRRIWENAEVTVYDCELNVVKISSGSESNKFIVNEKVDGNITIKYVVNNKEANFPLEKPVADRIRHAYQYLKRHAPSIPFFGSANEAEIHMIEN
ncbi:uncharacterized protein [Mytilus edulis]|uniref:uncharacterized protein isoform X2 n=1 Tax=Mytilus edulis TaxID=6550 RepID=UPI0039F01FC7